MRKLNILILISLPGLLLLNRCQSAPEGLVAPRTILEEREDFHKRLINETILTALETPLSDSSEGRWQGAFWGMELAGYRSTLTDSAISLAMSELVHRSPEFQRALLEVIYTLYPQQYCSQLNHYLSLAPTPKLFAMSAVYLLRENPLAYEHSIQQEMLAGFPNWSQDPILAMLNAELQPPAQTPPLKDLLDPEFLSGQTVLFSFQPVDRDYGGILLIRQPDGEFLQDPDSGGIFAIRQLARAVTDLPWYLTNGNTPPGIYSLQGTELSSNAFIGPSPTLQLRMPFECDPQTFFHGEISQTVWSREAYQRLLPNSWEAYTPIWGSYFAGQAGRSEIIAHGTTINPEYYRTLPCYPLTPSLGCLTSLELWSLVDGSCIRSDQQRLIRVLDEGSLQTGYLVVVPVVGKGRNLLVDDIVALLDQQ